MTAKAKPVEYVKKVERDLHEFCAMLNEARKPDVLKEADVLRLIQTPSLNLYCK